MLLLPLMLFSQQRPKSEKRLEALKAQKVAFITAKLDLTPEEAQHFWPVYNEYNLKKEEILKGKIGKKNKPRPEEVENMSDEEASRLLDQIVADQERMAAIEKEYSARFRKLLPVKKVLKLFDAEMEFRKVLLDRIRDSRPEKKRP